MTKRAYVLALCLCLLLVPSVRAQAPMASLNGPIAPAAAGETTSDQPPPTPPHTGVKAFLRNLGDDFVALPSVPNLWIAGIGGGAALAAHAADDTFNRRLHGAGDFFQAGELLGETSIQLAGALGTYVVGRWKQYPKAAHAGMDLLRAQIVAQALTQGIKVSVRRERPDGTRFAFPSGHASVTVATATVIERHFGLAWSLPLYGTASYVALSRLRDNRHWLSDVVFGAAVGEIAGRTVTRHGRSTYTWVPLYTPDGVALVITRGIQ